MGQSRQGVWAMWQRGLGLGLFLPLSPSREALLGSTTTCPSVKGPLVIDKGSAFAQGT